MKVTEDGKSDGTGTGTVLFQGAGGGGGGGYSTPGTGGMAGGNNAGGDAGAANANGGNALMNGSGGGAGGKNSKSGGNGAQGVVVLVYTLTPGAPTGLTAGATMSTIANLSWTAPVAIGGSAISGYQVLYGTSAGTIATVPGSGTCKPATAGVSVATECTVEGLTGGQTYYFTVAAINSYGTGTASISTSKTMPTHGPLDHFAVTASPSGSIASPQTAGTAFDIKITAQDSGNNTVTSFTGAGNTVDLSTGSLFKTGASTVASSFTTGTFTNGVLTTSVTLTKAGSHLIFATRTTGGSETGQSNSFNVDAGATRLIVGLPGQTRSAGQIGGFTGTVSSTLKVNVGFNVGVYLADEFGNLVTNAGADATITLSPAAGTLTPTTATMVQGGTSAGFTGVKLTNANTGGTMNLSATGAGAGATADAKTGTSAAFAVAKGTPTALTITSASSKAFGASLALTAGGGLGNTSTPSFAVTTTGTAGCTITGTSLTTTGNAGTTCGITATKVTDSNWEQVVSAEQTITVTRATNTIDFGTPTTKTFGGTAFLLRNAAGTGAVSATSGEPVTMTSNTPLVCTVAGQLVTIVGAGTCSITASQAQSTNYQAAPDVTRQFTVDKANQATLTIDSPATAVYGTTITLVASGGSGTGARSFEKVSGTCSISGSTLTLGNVGDACSIRAKRAGDDNYNVAYSTDNAAPAQSVTVTQAGQVLSFTSVVPTTPAAADTYTPTAISKSTATNADSGLTPTIALSSGTSSAVCTMTGGVVTFHGSGNCVIEATSAATNNFTAATAVAQTIVVGKRNQAITFTQPNNVGYGTSSLTMSAAASSGLVVDYSLGAGTTNSACTVSPLGVVTVLAVGICEVTASQPATGSLVWAAASPVTRSFSVTASLPTAPTITSVSAGDTAVTLAFSAPSFDGGVAITAYEITATPTLTPLALVTNSACDPAAVPLACTITLTNGTEYTLTVAAMNSAGTGPASTATIAVTPAAAAFAVADLAATPGNVSLAVSWTPLTTAQLNGGNFTGYQVSYCIASTGCATPGDWTAWSDANLVGAANQGATGTTITGLSNATAYTVRVIAITTANGTAMPGNSATVAESPATLPGTPLSLHALSPTATSLQVSWMVPATDGGSVLIAPYYVVTITSPDGGAAVTCTPSGTNRFCTVPSGLTNGKTYNIAVVARNRIGDSATPATTSFTVASSNPALASLVVESAPGSPVALTPTFDPTITTYTGSVSNGVASVTLTPTAAAPGSVVEVDGASVVGGLPTAPIPLVVGPNTITVTVTAPDPTFTRTYTLVITRAPAPAPDGGGGDGSGEDNSDGGGGGTAQNPSTTLPTTVLDDLFGPGNWPPGTNGNGTVGVDPHAGHPGIALVDGVLAPSTWGPTLNASGWHVVIPGIGGNGTGSASGGVGGGASFTMDISARSQARRPVPTLGNELRVPQYGYVDVRATGFASNTPVGVFAIPLTALTALTAKTGVVSTIPKARALPAGVVQIGSIRADASGRVDATFAIGDLPIGQYLLQVNGQSASAEAVSVNARMQVVSASETAQVRKAAFFKARTAKLSGKGKTRMRALAQAVPADARDVKVAVVGVSLSMGMPSANLRLAGKRADKIVKRLNAKGVHGSYTVTLHVEGDIDAAGNRKVRVLHYNADGDLIVDTQVPAHSAAGRALSTATVTFTTTL